MYQHETNKTNKCVSKHDQVIIVISIDLIMVQRSFKYITVSKPCYRNRKSFTCAASKPLF